MCLCAHDLLSSLYLKMVSSHFAPDLPLEHCCRTEGDGERIKDRETARALEPLSGIGDANALLRDRAAETAEEKEN